MSFREAFFTAPAVAEHVEVAHPAGTVRVYAMTAAEKDAFDIAHTRADGKHFRARLVVATVRDEQGRPIFSDADLAALSARPVTDLEPLVEAAIRVNRMSERDREDLEKNSPSRADGFSTDSLSLSVNR